MSAIGASGISLTNSITFTFAAGARTAHEVNQDCINTLTLSEVTATVLTFSEPQTASCDGGTGRSRAGAPTWPTAGRAAASRTRHAPQVLMEAVMLTDAPRSVRHK